MQHLLLLGSAWGLDWEAPVLRPMEQLPKGCAGIRHSPPQELLREHLLELRGSIALIRQRPRASVGCRRGKGGDEAQWGRIGWDCPRRGQVDYNLDNGGARGAASMRLAALEAAVAGEASRGGAAGRGCREGSPEAHEGPEQRCTEGLGVVGRDALQGLP